MNWAARVGIPRSKFVDGELDGSNSPRDHAVAIAKDPLGRGLVDQTINCSGVCASQLSVPDAVWSIDERELTIPSVASKGNRVRKILCEDLLPNKHVCVKGNAIGPVFGDLLVPLKVQLPFDP